MNPGRVSPLLQPAPRPPEDGPRRRAARKKRTVPLIVSIPIALALLIAVLGFGSIQVFKRTCTLDSLRPVRIGQNSFVYAADGIAPRLDPGRA